MKSQTMLVVMAEKHWREHRPKMYAEMKKVGTLGKNLQDAAKQTLLEMHSLISSGMTETEAWHTTRETY